MRGRIRTFKPEYLTEEWVWDLSVETGMPIYQGYQGLWSYSDREGRFEWRPRALKAAILPYWSGDFEEFLWVLVNAGVIVRYEVDGRFYGWCKNLGDNQSFNAREPPSMLPAPPDGVACESREPPVNVASPREDDPARVERKGTEGKGREGSGNDATVSRDSAREPGPPSSPEVTRIQRVGSPGVARVYSMPSEEPPKDYIDEAVMRAVSAEQARSTWAHYWAAGLPERGVEKLYPWLLKQAKERANSQQRAGPKGSSNRIQGLIDRANAMGDDE